MDPADIPLWFESDSLGKGVLVEADADAVRIRKVAPDDGERLVRFLRTFERLLGEALREGCGSSE